MQTRAFSTFRSRFFIHTRSYSQVSPFDYSEKLTRERDYWSWYSSNFLPKPLQTANLVFNSLHLELMTITKKSEGDFQANPAKSLKSQWWKDSILLCNNVAALSKKGESSESLLEAIPKHPILQSLYKIFLNFSLDKNSFLPLIKAHSEVSVPFTITDLEAYASDSIGTLYALNLNCIWQHYGESYSDAQKHDIYHCANHYAIAFSLFQLLRATPHQLANRVCFIPAQLLAESQISTEDLYRGRASKDAISDVVFKVATAAHQHLHHANDLYQKIPKNSKRLFNSRVIVDDYLNSLQKANFDIFDKSLQNPKPLKWQLLFVAENLKLTWSKK